ncbi:MAG: tRNA lysidine(34) synthetase TilS [Acidobacteria bacterium]|nr:MAG: tRNA lysidine(34) synthetase TilS [Acidobacteriota bacterium]
MLPDSVRRFFEKHCIEPCAVLAAVSGGADSTALLLALAELRDDGFTIIAAHVNHHLRGAESDDDEQFVRELCASVEVELRVADGTLDEERVKHRGIEAAAREVRYAKLFEIRDRVVRASGALSERRAGGAHHSTIAFIATAHQKNDQAETVLMRLLTGSGIGGLRGIHAVRGDGVVRPLLDVTREEIETFLRARNVTPRHDRSNDDPRFLRNRIRVLVRELGAVDNLAAIAAQARQQWPILERAVDDAESHGVDVEENETRFRHWPDDPWLRQALLHRHIHRLDASARDVSANDLARLANEVDAIKRVSVTKDLELIRRNEALVLRRVPSAMPEFEVSVALDSPIDIPQLGITMHVIPSVARDLGGRGALHEPRTATRAPAPSLTLGMTQLVQLQRGALHEPRTTTRAPAPSLTLGLTQLVQLQRGASPSFTIRNRRRGDRFHPLGSPAPKKLKDFLIDRKIAAELRDRIPLLVWNDEIVWVAGVEVSERFKVSDAPGDRYEVWLEGSYS